MRSRELSSREEDSRRASTVPTCTARSDSRDQLHLRICYNSRSRPMIDVAAPRAVRLVGSPCSSCRLIDSRGSSACHRANRRFRPTSSPRVGERMRHARAIFKRYLDRNTGTDLARSSARKSPARYARSVRRGESSSPSTPASARRRRSRRGKIARPVRTDAGATVIEKRDEMRREKLIGDHSAERRRSRPTTTSAPTTSSIRPNSERRGGARPTDPRARRGARERHRGEAEGGRAVRGALQPSTRSRRTRRRAARSATSAAASCRRCSRTRSSRLKPGSVSGIIRTDASFHIFKVDDRRPPGVDRPADGRAGHPRAAAGRRRSASAWLSSSPRAAPRCRSPS